jgi:hypothetical protein
MVILYFSLSFDRRSLNEVVYLFVSSCFSMLEAGVNIEPVVKGKDVCVSGGSTLFSITT